MPIDAQRALWNDDMYHKHPTPYGGTIAGLISAARVRTIVRLARIQPGDAVLEIGCEAGHVLVSLPPCKRLVGADISADALADAQALAHEKRREIECVQLDAEEALSFERGAFDVVILSEILEHVRSPRTVLERVRAICTPQTRVVITVPIERPKLAIKRALSSVGLLALLFPGIEKEQSEWHLQIFSKALIRDVTAGLFRIDSLQVVWGCHYAALLHAV